VRVIVLLIAAGGSVAAGFLAAFVWAVRSGQYDDAYTPAVRILFDDTSTMAAPAAEGLTDDQLRS
jgi:cbb3-type cytochrome oxidase maturation protein